MSSVANSEESHRNSPDRNAGTSSVSGGGGGGAAAAATVVVVKRVSPSSPQQSSHVPTVAEHHPAPQSLPKQTTVIATEIKDVDPKKTTVETTNVARVTGTTTTTTTTGSAPSQNNRRRNPLSQQSGVVGGGGGGGGDSGRGGNNGEGGLDNVLPSQGNNGHSVAPAGDRSLSRACCFCWCCCCSCSSLTVRNNDENSARTRDANKLEILNGENEPPPTLEDIRAWGESFDRLMRCSAGRKVFRDFLRCEYSEENILFWLACEELKRETNAESVEEKARLIYEDYISILSPKEVSLDSRVREVINRNMVEPSPHTFDEAQLQIYTLMHRDSYPRFVNSPIYKKLAQMNTSSRKESSA